MLTERRLSWAAAPRRIWRTRCGTWFGHFCRRQTAGLSWATLHAYTLGKFRPVEGVLVARRLFTSESVTEGHPDKIADQISDGVLDALLSEDPRSRVAVETLITTGQVHVAGEVTTKAYADIPNIVRETILRIGYDSSKKGFDGGSCGVNIAIGSQSPDIAHGVDSAIELRSGEAESAPGAPGAGEQGVMFRVACSESP